MAAIVEKTNLHILTIKISIGLLGLRTIGISDYWGFGLSGRHQRVTLSNASVDIKKVCETIVHFQWRLSFWIKQDKICFLLQLVIYLFINDLKRNKLWLKNCWIGVEQQSLTHPEPGDLHRAPFLIFIKTNCFEMRFLFSKKNPCPPPFWAKL